MQLSMFIPSHISVLEDEQGAYGIALRSEDPVPALFPTALVVREFSPNRFARVGVTDTRCILSGLYLQTPPSGAMLLFDRDERRSSEQLMASAVFEQSLLAKEGAPFRASWDTHSFRITSGPEQRPLLDALYSGLVRNSAVILPSSDIPGLHGILIADYSRHLRRGLQQSGNQ